MVRKDSIRNLHLAIFWYAYLPTLTYKRQTYSCPTYIHTVHIQITPQIHMHHIHSSGLGDHVDQDKAFPALSCPCLIVSYIVYHCRKATWYAILLQACKSPTRIISPSLAACHASPCLSPTEQLSCLTKLSLTHPTSSLPSSHHHLAILHFHRRNNLHLHPLWFICILTLF